MYPEAPRDHLTAAYLPLNMLTMCAYIDARSKYSVACKRKQVSYLEQNEYLGRRVLVGDQVVRRMRASIS